jgi:formylglycine-generating enzyme required for sulfatase activity
MKEKVQKVKEFVWQKYVDYVHPASPEIVEAEALDVLNRHFATVEAEVDPESYYLAILLFEVAFQNAEVEKLYLAKAKTIFEQYRARTGETDWDVIEDRLEEIEDALSVLGPDERAEIFAQVESDRATPGGAETARFVAAPIVEGMVYIPAGTYLSGEDNEEAELEAFLIDTYPVTNADFKKFMEATGYRAPRFWSEGRLEDPRAPVVGVSWYDADKYATWAGKQLPTSAMWEKAARGLEGRIYPWGNEIDETKANYGHGDGVDLVVPVDEFKDNHSVFGVYDLAGNTWEWTRDWDKIEIDMKVIRGGSWADPADFLRLDRQLYANPKDKYDNIGFRCVRPAD